MSGKVKYYFGLSTAFLSAFTAASMDRPLVLEEIAVTAQKREQSLQTIPVAVSVLDEAQLTAQRITSLTHLIDGSVSSLQIRPHPDDSSTPIITIRGNGPGDIVDAIREAPVAVYFDEVYISRTQGMGMELADIERIEILRGPQGTLFGRNATGGAISIISKQPTGKLGIKQLLGVGRFNEWRSLTHLNLPEWEGVKTKISYLHAERDGWVENSAPNEWDFNAYDRDSGQLSVSLQPTNYSTLNYSYDISDSKASQLYFQVDKDFIGVFGNESKRQTKTRFPVSPLEPTIIKQQGHMLTLSTEVSSNIILKSITSHRELDNKTRNNYAGAYYLNGIVLHHDIEQNQQSQEFRFVGDFPRIELVAGFYYFQEEADTMLQSFYSLDIAENGVTPIDPLDSDPLRNIESEASSTALYGHVVWTPPVFDDKLKVSLGLRRTIDKRSGAFAIEDLNLSDTFELDTRHTDPDIDVSYEWTKSVMSYAKWGTAFRGGGVNSLFSLELNPFKEEEVSSFELGLKTEWANNRVRINTAIFWTDYIDAILDMFNQETFEAQAINAKNKVEVDGAELDLSIIPLEGLRVGFSYTYLDGYMPLQPNPLEDGALVQFKMAQTPKHAGSLTVDYVFNPWRVGTLNAHLNVISTDNYHFFPQNADITDGYSLINARLELDKIPTGRKEHNLAASFWVNNVTNESYTAFGIAFDEVDKVKAYGPPRTFGIEIIYQF